MNKLKFEIEEIHAGWFVFRLNQETVWSSNVWEHDSPRELLQMLLRCSGGERGYTVFDEEPGTNVLAIDGSGLRLLFCEESSNEWPEEELHGGGIMPEWAARQTLVLQAEHFDLFAFTCAVVDAFVQIDREEYARNWMPFPEEELAALTEKLRILKMLFGERYGMLMLEMPHREIRHLP